MILVIQPDLICLAVLIVVLLNLNSTMGRSSLQEDRLFRSVILAVTAAVLADGLSLLVDGRLFPCAILLNNILNVLNFILTGTVGFLWLLYVLSKLRGGLALTIREKCFLGLPAALLLALAFFTPWSGWMFHIDMQNVYHRGSLFWLELVIAAGYVAAATFAALRAARYTESWALRREYRLLSHFVLPPAVGCVLQMLQFGSSMLWVGVTVAALIVFVNFQNKQISIDPLTGLNNRGRFDRYLAMEMEEKQEELYLVLLDIDAFKTINDREGHVAGDRALSSLAAALKRVCGRRDVFLARFGGDEFALICHFHQEDEVKALLQELCRETEQSEDRQAESGPLRFSAGYARYVPEEGAFCSSETLIAAADQKMYEEKQRHRQLGASAAVTK